MIEASVDRNRHFYISPNKQWSGLSAVELRHSLGTTTLGRNRQRTNLLKNELI